MSRTSKNETDKIETIIENFIQELKKGENYKLISAGHKSANDYECNIYNEISFQHELGKYIEDKLSEEGYKVFYEKNIYDTKEEKEEMERKQDDVCVKKEVDIVIVRNDNEKMEKYAIELKFSKGENARTPENLFDYIKDIKFMEFVKKEKEYTNVYNLMIANSQKYYNHKLNKKILKNKYNIYEMFRKDTGEYYIPKKPNKIEKYCNPTGSENSPKFILDKTYSGKWEMLLEKESNEIFQYKYILINHNKCIKNNIDR